MSVDIVAFKWLVNDESSMTVPSDDANSESSMTVPNDESSIKLLKISVLKMLLPQLLKERGPQNYYSMRLHM